MTTTSSLIIIIILLFITVLSFLSVSAQSVSCVRDNQCNMHVSLRRDFVSCINNQCVCATTRGFSGNATLANKCRCVAPSKIYRIEDGDTYCYKGRVDPLAVFSDNDGRVEYYYAKEYKRRKRDIVANMRA